MMRCRAKTLVVVMAAILGLMVTPAAWAEDEAKGDSAAEQAFRDAWWAETSSGALDRALDGYRKAVAAEGPAAVRAKALYRSAVVLERIGKTDDAIRALEQLAEDFPGEADLQAKARDRLEAWTAVDLQTNFQEWYERYKYSPEFQGRIVELVLALGASSGEAGASNRAAEELLTIGQASVPALEAHLDSSNQKLRGRAVDLLLQLGTYPHARHLLETDDWGKMQHGWSALLASPLEARTRLLSELDAIDAESKTVDALRAVLRGPESWPRAIEIAANTQLNRAVLDSHPDESVLKSLRDLVGRLEPRSAVGLAYLLLAGGHVPVSVAHEWLALEGVRDEVATKIHSGDLADAGNWRALVDAMNALPIDDPVQSVLYRAMMRSLSDASSNADLRPAVQAYERVTPSGRVRITTNQMGSAGLSRGASGMLEDADAVSRFLSQVVDEARDPRVAQDALNAWVRLHRGDDDVSNRLIAWSQSETSPEVNLPAAKFAGSLATDATLDALLGALGNGTPAVDGELLDGLRKNRMVGSLTWGDERYLKLNAYAQAASVPKRDLKLVQQLERLFLEFHKLPERIDQATRLALKVPRRVWIGITRNLDKSILPFLNDPAYLATVRAGFRTKWVHWPLEDRIAALQWFKGLPAPVFDDTELMEFLRGELGTQWAAKGDVESAALEQKGKELILGLLPDVGLADVRQVYDVSTAEGALAAWELRCLPMTEEVYEALSAARDTVDAAERGNERYNFLNHWMRGAPAELGYRAAAEMAVDASAHVRASGLLWLARRRAAEDVRLFEKALADSDATVRHRAAEALAGVYDQDAIRALASALDDPSPQVRDRILATLEAIRTIEEKKDYWREFAEGKR